MNSRILSLLVLLVLILLTSCAPQPRMKLTPSQRRADLDFLFQKIESNYAPILYKQERHSFDYSKLKQSYFTAAEVDQSNDEFYILMQRLIAEFRDAHMSGGMNLTGLPGRSTVTYLGFFAQRKGETVFVNRLLATYAATSSFPIKVGDEIIEFDGMKIRDAVSKFARPLRNFGNEEANFTGSVGRLFSRPSVAMPMPQEKSVKLKVKRGGTIFTVDLPWITKDWSIYMKEQQEAAVKKALLAGVTQEQIDAEELAYVQALALLQAQRYATTGFVRSVLSGSRSGTELREQLLATLPTRSPFNTFEVSYSDPLELAEFYALLAEKLSAAATQPPPTPLEILKKTRWVPERIIPVPTAKTYPAYVAVYEKDKKRYFIGYVRIGTFSPAGAEKDVLKEFKETLLTFRDFGPAGVDKIVLDLLDNGGGSLSLGMHMAQLLSFEELKMPSLKVRLNDTWLDTLENSARSSASDSEAEIHRRSYEDALGAQNRGDLLGPGILGRSLYPFTITPNQDLEVEGRPFKFQVITLVNEMCASMCDIFTSILKDNELARVVGKQTMGAGGNVVQHGATPNTGFTFNLTESLILSPNGEFLENNGVKPDLEIEVTDSADKKYEDLLKKTFEAFIPPVA